MNQLSQLKAPSRGLLDRLLIAAGYVFMAGMAYSGISDNADDIVVVQSQVADQAKEFARVRADIAAIKEADKSQSRDVQRILEILERRYAPQ